MGFLDSLRGLFAGTGTTSGGGYYIYVRCNRCGEALRTRVNLQNDLSESDAGGYVLNKTLVGSGRCFERIEVHLEFNPARQLTGREISGGEFITAQEFDQYWAQSGNPAPRVTR
ncbi:MAG: hypothetical protein ACP5R2_01580 [Anaerolineae bacterium]